MKKRIGLLLIAFLLAVCTATLAACDSGADYSAHAGKYYAYEGNVKKSDEWVELNANGTWTDNLNASGTFEINGSAITIKIGGETLMTGTVNNGVMTVSFMGMSLVYKKDGASSGGENPGGEDPGGENPGGEDPGGEDPGQAVFYTVTFETNGGNEVPSQQVKSGERALAPAQNPTKEGFVFEGWYSDSQLENVFNFNSDITQATTIYAKWTNDPNSIDFHLNGGSNPVGTKVSYNASEAAVALPVPTKQYYIFDGWYTSENFDGYPNTRITEIPQGTTDVFTVYAKWYSTGLGFFLDTATDTYLVGGAFTLNQNNYGGGALVIPAYYQGKPVTRIGTDYSGSYLNSVNTFENNTSFTTLIIPSTVVKIDSEIQNGMFQGCTSLTEVLIEGTSELTEIGNNSFNGCSSLQACNFPSSLTIIGTSAFRYTALIEVDLGGTAVTELNENVFSNCTSLISVVLPDGLNMAPWSNGSFFYGCSKLATIEIAQNNASFVTHDNVLYRDMEIYFVPMAISGEIEIYNGVTNISYNAFASRTELRAVNLNGVLTIDNAAFNGCTSLAEVTGGNNVIEVGASAFQDTLWLSEQSGFVCLGQVLVSYNGIAVQVVIPNNITVIASRAFYGQDQLNSVMLNNVVTISSYAFRDCIKLKSLVIPATVENIGQYAFVGCVEYVPTQSGGTTSETIHLYIPMSSSEKPAGWVTGWDRYVEYQSYIVVTTWNFAGKTVKFETYGVVSVSPIVTNTSGVSISEPEVPERAGFTFEGWYTDYSWTTPFNFSNTITADITIYAKWAHEYFGLRASENGLIIEYLTEAGLAQTTLTIPAGVSEIMTISSDNLQSINVETSNRYYSSYNGVLYSKDRKTLIIAPLALSGSYEIPSGVNVIEAYAFNGCRLLNSLTIPSSVTIIDSFFWEGISITWYYNPLVTTEKIRNNLTVVIIPDGLEEIPDGKFGLCSILESITIPGSVKIIGRGAFGGCTSLTSVIIEEGVEEIGQYAFAGCTSLTSIIIPDSVKLFGGAFSGCTSLTSIIIPGSVKIIGGGAFNGCTSLTSVIIEEGVEEIQWDVFTDTKLTEIFIPSSVVSINGMAFVNCTLLTAITVSELNEYYKSIDGVLYYVDNRYVNANTLVCYPMGKTKNTFEIPAFISIIGERAFYGCESLLSVTFENGSIVEDIRVEAFYNCVGIKNLTISSDIVYVNFSVFKGWQADQTIYIVGFSSEAEADAAWGTGWREGCNAQIVYQG